MAELDRLEGRFEQFEKRLTEGLAAVHARIDDLGTRLGEGLAAVNTRIDDLGKRVSDLQWMVGLGVGWLTAVIAAAVGIILKYR
jgi:hypothetical protein